MLSNAHFYYQLTRKYVILFGNMFNDISIIKKNRDNGQEIERFKVPVVYAPKEKYYARLRSDPDLNRPIQVVLPRISFELVGFNYDASRKQNSLLRNAKGNNSSKANSQYMGVPYDLTFDLQIYSRNIDDGTHVVEQILPYFNPDYTVTIDSIPEMGFLKDIPIILNSVENTIEHEGNFDAVRYVAWTLNFTVKAYYYGPISTPKIIRKAITNIYNDPSLKAGYITKLNLSPTGNGNFSIGDTVYQGSSYNIADAYGEVVKWDPTNNKLILSGVQGQFKADHTIRGLTSNTVYSIISFDAEPVKLASITTEPNPIDAQPGDDFGYTNTILEFPETE